MSERTRGGEFWRGVRDEAPILLGVVPFGVIFGAYAANVRISAGATQAMSLVMFAGSAQFIAAQLIGAGTSSLVLLLVVAIVNLRHALYSASVAPFLKGLRPGWKLVLAYLLTDEAYVVTITHFNQPGEGSERHWYFLGAGLTLWSSWQASTAGGILAGSRMPQDWPLGFVLPLTFIALVVPALKDRAGVVAAISAGAVGVLAAGLPYMTGLLLAAFIGIAAGVAVGEAGVMKLALTILLAGLLTFAIRLSFILALERLRMPGWFRRALDFVPIAVLSAIIVPDLVVRNGVADMSPANAQVVAGLGAVLVAWRTKNVLLTIGAGMALLLVAQAVLPRG